MCVQVLCGNIVVPVVSSSGSPPPSPPRSAWANKFRDAPACGDTPSGYKCPPRQHWWVQLASSCLRREGLPVPGNASETLAAMTWSLFTHCVLKHKMMDQHWCVCVCLCICVFMCR